jgi:hypothetical protein
VRDLDFGSGRRIIFPASSNFSVRHRTYLVILRLSSFPGGKGGKGGDGGLDGAGGGTGGGVRLSKRLVSMGKEARYRAPSSPLTHLDLDYDFLHLLYEEGFVTVGGLLEVYDYDLEDAGFKVGHIARLRRALTKFLAKCR